MAIHIREEANRCLNCKKPMCRAACPVDTPIPEIIQMFRENRTLEAGEKLLVLSMLPVNHNLIKTKNVVLLVRTS